LVEIVFDSGEVCEGGDKEFFYGIETLIDGVGGDGKSWDLIIIHVLCRLCRRRALATCCGPCRSSPSHRGAGRCGGHGHALRGRDLFS
jgi:hypothetical protein